MPVLKLDQLALRAEELGHLVEAQSVRLHQVGGLITTCTRRSGGSVNAPRPTDVPATRHRTAYGTSAAGRASAAEASAGDSSPAICRKCSTASGRNR